MLVTVAVIRIEMEMRQDALLVRACFKLSSYEDLSRLPFVVSRMYFTVLSTRLYEVDKKWQPDFFVGGEMCKKCFLC